MKLPLMMDAHLHLRDHELMQTVVPFSEAQCKYAMIMPNLRPAITNLKQAKAYKKRIEAVCPSLSCLMTLYASNLIDLEQLEKGFHDRIFSAIKLYPKNVTTNAEQGVSSLYDIYPLLSCMESIGIPLLIHGEITDKDTDIFDREALFLERQLAPLMEKFPQLSITLEHITTQQAINFVQKGGPNIYATITPHHLLINRNALFENGIRPHHYCLPIAKREKHRLALLEAAASGSHKFFAGSDSAPHTQYAKESACGCAGIFNAAYLIEYYYMAFQEYGDFSNLRKFLCDHAYARYDIEIPKEEIGIYEQEQTIKEYFPSQDSDKIIPFWAGKTLPITAKKIV